MSRDLEAARKMDEMYDYDKATAIAIRKFVNELAGTGEDTDVGPVEAAFRALDAIETLHEENQELRERVAELEGVVTPDPDRVDYEQLTRSQKVRRVRQKLVEQAMDARNGRASMGYKDVKWLFDGNPSSGHCYDLMRLAAKLDGFEYDDGGSTHDRVLVDLEDVKDESLLHAANKDAGEEAV